MDDQQEMKSLENALCILWALDKRQRLGQMDATAEQALRDAEAVVESVSGRKLLQAWRLWRDHGSRERDPTGGYVRNTGERSPGATSTREVVSPVQSFRDCKPERERTGR